MQKEKTSHKTLTQNVNIHTDERTDRLMERWKLYTPQHTLYTGGINTPRHTLYARGIITRKSLEGMNGTATVILALQIYYSEQKANKRFYLQQ